MIRRPPRATPFPYTTLFRSLRTADVDTAILGCTHYPLIRPIFQRVFGRGVTLVFSAEETAREVAETLARKGIENDPEDRKSTRLNSSHSQISYAVFCLKTIRSERMDDILHGSCEREVGVVDDRDAHPHHCGAPHRGDPQDDGQDSQGRRRSRYPSRHTA